MHKVLKVQKVHFLCAATFGAMDGHQTIRKVQDRQGSLTITIPKKIAKEMGLQGGMHVRIAESGGRMTVELVGRNPPEVAASDPIHTDESDLPAAQGEAGNGGLLGGLRM